MPTTILDNETYPEALQRRYAEETKAEIIRLAREAHQELVTLDYPGHTGQLDPWTMRLLERFAALVAARKAEIAMAEAYRCGYEAGAAHEREACAKVCEQDEFQIYETAERCAAAIRARGEK